MRREQLGRQPTPEGAPASLDPVLEVISGLHRGVLLSLDRGEYRIGSTPKCDIVLQDAGIEPEHAVLRIERHRVDVEAVNGGVRVGAKVVPKGHGCRVRLPLDIFIGEAHLRLSRPDGVGAFSDGVRRTPTAGDFLNLTRSRLDGFRQIDFARINFADLRLRMTERANSLRARMNAEQVGEIVQSLRRRPIVMIGAALCCIFAISLFAARGTPQSERDRQQLPESVLLNHVVSPPASVAESTASDRRPSDHAQTIGAAQSNAALDEAARDLTARLNTEGLRTLSVRVADRHLVVSGNLAKRQAAAWAAVQQWFDHSYAGLVLLATNVTVGDNRAMPTLQLQAVWYGKQPYIITAEGMKYYQGAFLDNGWTVQEIGEDRVVLAKDGETLALTYR